MEYEVPVEKGMINRGNWYRIKKCMKKAMKGERLVTAFLGGSITQGSLASSDTTCYAYLVYEWWVSKFPKSKFTFVNAGIGATDSQYGAARVEEHALSAHPDFMMVEFAVNDENTAFYRETYEGVVRKVYGDRTEPALLLMNNICYDTGVSAADQHIQVAQAYELPMVSMKTTIFPEVDSDRIPRREITPDDLHPNDAGHRLVADVIIHFLEMVYADLANEEESALFAGKRLPNPITENAFEDSRIYQNYNSTETAKGFAADRSKKENIRDIFKDGWTANAADSKIHFTVTGTEIAVQYRKSTQKPTPIAQAIVDGDEANAVTLDGNFEETWGDKLQLTTVARHLKSGKHDVEIRIVENHEDDVVPFYLVSVIASR